MQSRDGKLIFYNSLLPKNGSQSQYLLFLHGDGACNSAVMDYLRHYGARQKHSAIDYATALSCLADPEIKPIDQTSARFYRRVAIDTEYGGMADNADEALRLTRAVAGKRVLMMGNHGVLVVGDSVAEAFDTLYHLERACRTLVLAYSTGRPLSILADEIAERTALSWEDGGAFASAHFAQMKRLLDAEQSCYAD